MPQILPPPEPLLPTQDVMLQNITSGKGQKMKNVAIK
jgi:hypothetical protein